MAGPGPYCCPWRCPAWCCRDRCWEQGVLVCDAILPARIAPVFVWPARQNGLYSGPTAGTIRAESTVQPLLPLLSLGGGWDRICLPLTVLWPFSPSRATPQTVRPQHPLPQDRSPEDIFAPKRIRVSQAPHSSKGSCCKRPLWIRREREFWRAEESPPGTADKAVQAEEAVERREEERRQAPSPPPSPGKGRPRRRSICLLLPAKTHPLVLNPELIPADSGTEMLVEEEVEAALQRSRRLLGPKAATRQRCSGTSGTRAANVTTASVGSGQAVPTSTGTTDSTQPRSGNVPVLPGTPAPICGQWPSGFGRHAASSGSSKRTRSKNRACKRHKAWIHHFCNK